MSQVLIGIIAAMGIAGYLYYQGAVLPMRNKLEEQANVILAQDLRDQEQKAAIEAIQDNLENTSKALSGMQLKNQQYETQMSEYLDIFRRHNIAKLASQQGIEVHAGHGLNYETTKMLSSINEIEELNIGFFIISESLFKGLDIVIRDIRSCMSEGRSLGEEK